MQCIPETARRIGSSYGVTVESPESVHRPEVAIRLGAYYLAELLRIFDGQEAPAVAAYNAGEEISFIWLRRAGGGLDDFLREIEYKETRTYVDRVLTSLAAYRSRVRD